MAIKRAVEKWESKVWMGEMFGSKKECEVFDFINDMGIFINIQVARGITSAIISNEDKIIKLVKILKG